MTTVSANSAPPSRSALRSTTLKCQYPTEIGDLLICRRRQADTCHRRALRRPTVERLATLMHRKRELEARAVKCQVELARSFEEAAQQLQASIDGRVEDTAA